MVVVTRLDLVVRKYIQNSPRKSYVKDSKVKVGSLPGKLRSKLKIKDARVYISTKSLKHIYDSRIAKDFTFIIKNLKALITQPIGVYKNKYGKTGDLCFYSVVDKESYFCILDTKLNCPYIISVYKLSVVKQKRESYLSGYKLLWSWKVDLPSS